MKTLRLFAISFGLLTLSFLAAGCNEPKLQKVLDQNFPPAYRGDARFVHKNPWVDVTVEIKNLRKEDGVWRYDSATYRRNGRFSHGELTLQQPK